MPLYFVVVNTNVDYQVNAAFITEDECAASIVEALNVLKNVISSGIPHSL